MSKFFVFCLLVISFIVPAQAIESTILKGDYTPTQQDIQTAEKVMKEAVKTEEKIKDLNHYARQYQGMINKKGEKIIWINCFCSTQPDKDFPYWRKHEVLVLDGGACFFNLKVNITTGEYYDFGVNGDA